MIEYGQNHARLPFLILGQQVAAPDPIARDRVVARDVSTSGAL